MARSTLIARVAAPVLVCVWAVFAIALVVAYRTGGPADALLGLAALLPVVIALAGAIRPPLLGRARAQLATLWLAISATLLLVPLVGELVEAARNGARDAVAPSPEALYAAVVALALTSLFSGLGMVSGGPAGGRADPAGRAAAGALLVRGAAAAVGMTLAGAVAFGAAAGATREAAIAAAGDPSASAWGPTEPGSTPPDCRTAPAVGTSARVDVIAEASVDGDVLASATIAGARSGSDERWTGHRTGILGDATAAYARIGEEAWWRAGDARWEPATVGLPRPRLDIGPVWPPPAPRDDGTLDTLVREAIVLPDGQLVVEDLGIELVGGARARHCRTATHGPEALATVLALRWLVSDDLTAGQPLLEEWRGDIDWWTFADGTLGLVRVEIGGAPGDAWPTSGLHGTLRAELRAVERGTPQRIEAPVT